MGAGGDLLRLLEMLGARGCCCKEVDGVGEAPGKTAERAGLDLMRAMDVGIVNRKAAGFDDGVDGRVGGTCISIPCILLVEFVCVRAREEAVAEE